MAAPPQENPWDPDPTNPHMYKNGRNSTHYLTVSRVRTTSLDDRDMKYLRTYKNVDLTDSDHDIDKKTFTGLKRKNGADLIGIMEFSAGS